jgi:hypothetical protein
MQKYVVASKEVTTAASAAAITIGRRQNDGQSNMTPEDVIPSFKGWTALMIWLPLLLLNSIPIVFRSQYDEVVE